MRLLVDGPRGEKYIVIAAAGPGGRWEVRAERVANGSDHRPQVFPVDDETVADRLVVQLGDDLRHGVLVL